MSLDCIWVWGIVIYLDHMCVSGIGLSLDQGRVEDY